MLLLAAGGLLPAGTASTAMRKIFLPLPLTKMRTSRINFKQVARPYWRKAIETKSRQTLVFDPGSCTSRQATAHFLEDDKHCFAGGFRLDAAMVSDAEAVFFFKGLEHIFPKTSTSDLACRTLLLRQIAPSPKPESNWFG